MLTLTTHSVIQGCLSASLAKYLPNVLGLHSLNNRSLASLYDYIIFYFVTLSSLYHFMSSLNELLLVKEGSLPVKRTYIIIPQAHESTVYYEKETYKGIFLAFEYFWSHVRSCSTFLCRIKP